MEYVKQDLSYLKYQTVFNESGEDVAKGNDSFTEVYYDSISESNLHNEFKKGILVTSYRMIDGNKIYQNSNPTYDYKIKWLQNSLTKFLVDENFDFAVQSNAQGTLLLLLTIDEKGYILDYKFLNELHTQIDGAVLRYLKTAYVKLKPYKVGKEKRKLQVLVPISFNIKRFYRQPANYYNHMWHNDMMLQQQMHNDMIQNIQVPSFH